MNDVVLAENKIAMMVANGFNETEFIALQKAIMKKKAQAKIISSQIGLIYSDPKTGNGISYAVDYALSETLAVDYNCLIVVGGLKHVEKLSDEPHAIRLIRAFLRESMPILFVSEGSKLLEFIGDKRFSEKVKNDTICLKSDHVHWSVNGQGLSLIFNEFFEFYCAQEINKDSNNGVAA